MFSGVFREKYGRSDAAGGRGQDRFRTPFRFPSSLRELARMDICSYEIPEVIRNGHFRRGFRGKSAWIIFMKMISALQFAEKNGNESIRTNSRAVLSSPERALRDTIGSSGGIIMIRSFKYSRYKKIFPAGKGELLRQFTTGMRHAKIPK